MKQSNFYTTEAITSNIEALETYHLLFFFFSLFTATYQFYNKKLRRKKKHQQSINIFSLRAKEITWIIRQRLQRADLYIVLPSVWYTNLGAWIWTIRAIRGENLIVGTADIVPTLAAEQFGPLPEKSPWILRIEVRQTAKLIALSEPTLIDREEGDDPLLDRLPVLRADVRGIPIRRAQIQSITAISAAAIMNPNSSNRPHGIKQTCVHNST